MLVLFLSFFFLQMYFQDEVVQELKQIYTQLEEDADWDLSLYSLEQVILRPSLQTALLALSLLTVPSPKLINLPKLRTVLN